MRAGCQNAHDIAAVPSLVRPQPQRVPPSSRDIAIAPCGGCRPKAPQPTVLREPARVFEPPATPLVVHHAIFCLAPVREKGPPVNDWQRLPAPDSPDPPALADTRSSCNHTPKYRCPGCAARTCSLPCYKRHQQRAQCNGKRDPTKYVKKNQLSTPAGVDHDFNFIAGIERGLDTADRLMEENRIGSDRRTSKIPDRNSNLGKRLQEAGVMIDRAPAGMSREKNNKTHIQKKSKNLVWTVEWIHEDGRWDSGEVPENMSLSDAYVRRFLVKQPPQPSKKRRLEAGIPPAEPEERADPHQPHAESEEPELKPALSIKPATSSEPLTAPSDHGPKNDEPLTAPFEQEPKNNDPIGSHDPQVEQPKLPHFYLVKPHTSSTRRVLIPLAPMAQLSTCLRGRTVLEFPSIQLLSTAPDALPAQFQLEADYLEEARREQQELDELLKTVQPPPAGGMPTGDGDSDGTAGARATSIAELDDSKILEVLRRDLGSRG